MRSADRSFPSDLEHRVLAFMRTCCGISARAHVIVAVSGGADSLCLLHVLHRLADEFPLEIHVAHLDHMLRGNASGDDAAFVSGQAHDLGLPCTVESRDIAAYRSLHRCSIEEAAREVRYQFLREVACRYGAGIIMTGHTRDDAVETVMLHLVRGSGIHGLRGLEPVNAFPLAPEEDEDRDVLQIIRPLLSVTRDETLRYCRLRGLTHCEDASNESLDFLRNRMRLEVLPVLRQLNPRCDEALLRLAVAAAEDDDHIIAAANEVWARSVAVSKSCVRIDVQQFADSSPAVQARVVRRAIIGVAGSARDVATSHIVSVRSLAGMRPGKQVDLPCGVVWRREEATLLAFRRDDDPNAEVIMAPEQPVALAVPGETRIPGWRIVATCHGGPCDATGNELVAYLDLGRTGSKLSVRRRKPGDRFRPLGMQLEKKLQDFLVDAKVPSRFRDSIPLVTSESHIVWVTGWRIDDRVKVGPHTQEVLRLEFVRDPLSHAS